MINLKTHIAYIATWFQGISKDAGYLSDLGKVVSTERLAGNGEDRKLAAAVLLTGLKRVKRTPERKDWQFEVIVSVRVPINTKDSEAVSIDILEDLNQAVPSKVPSTPLGLQNVEVTEADILRQPDGANYNVVGMTLVATCFEYTNKST